MPSAGGEAGEAYAALGELLIGAHDLPTVGPEVLGRLAEVFGWSLAELWLVHHDLTSLRCEASWVSALLPTNAVAEFGAIATFRLGRGFPGTAWETRRPLISDDLSNDAGFVRKGPALALGLTGGLAFPLLLPDGEVAGVITTFFAPGDRSSSDLELLLQLGRWIGAFIARSRREAARRNARVLEVYRRLSATLADELNNALCVVLTGLGHLQEEGAEDEYLAESLASANHAAEVSRQLLLDTTPSPPGDEPVDLKGLIQGAARDLRARLGPHAQLELILGDRPLLVRGGERCLEQLIAHLVCNAGDAIGGCGQVVIRCRHQAGRHPDEPEGVLLSVSDDGVGMDEVSRGRALDPLYSTRGRAGLGLTQVHSVVTRLGGEVELRSRPGEGSTVAVRLPAVHARIRSHPSSPPVAHDGGPTLSGKVLLVEDSPALRRQLRRLLVSFGVEVLDTDSAEEALELFHEAGSTLSLLVTDIGLPGRSGARLARDLREITPLLPVLVMSGYPEEALSRHLEGCPHDGFLQKPFDAEVFLRELHGILNGREASQPQDPNA